MFFKYALKEGSISLEYPTQNALCVHVGLDAIKEQIRKKSAVF